MLDDLPAWRPCTESAPTIADLLCRVFQHTLLIHQ
jgi:hypothetical protein